MLTVGYKFHVCFKVIKHCSPDKTGKTELTHIRTHRDGVSPNRACTGSCPMIPQCFRGGSTYRFPCLNKNQSVHDSHL